MTDTETSSSRRLDFMLNDKVAIITGGGSGIGKPIAELFAAKGAPCPPGTQRISPRDGAGVRRSCASFYFGRDRLCSHQAHRGGDRRVFRSGRCFGQQCGDRLSRVGRRNIGRQVGPYHGGESKGCLPPSQAVGRYFLRQGHGKIVNIASQAAVVALANHLAYCTSKYGLLGLMQVLALEWGPRGVQVNAVSPTVVLTEMGRLAWAGEPGEVMKQEIPLRRFALPEEVAAAALFLASDAADMITGANLIVDGGYTIH